MPLELHIIHATDFARVDPRGHFDLPASKAALALLFNACRKRGINQALMDLRALHPGPKPVFSPADLAELVRTFGEVGFGREQRLAILYHSDPHRRARMFAFLSALHGWQVRAFGSFEEALLWLSSGPEAQPGRARPPQGKRIPIRVVRETPAPGRRARQPAPSEPTSRWGRMRAGVGEVRRGRGDRSVRLRARLS